MDEISFRVSEKLENFQIQMSLASQQTKELLQQYSERGTTLANQLWHSPKIEKLQDLVKEILHIILEVAEKSKVAILDVADPRKFVEEILFLLRNQVNRRSLFFGCIGFIIGGFVGYFIARSTKNNDFMFMSHMHAAACLSYGGIDCSALIDDIPIPRIEETDDILIQVKAASVSILDVKICQGYGRRIRKLMSKYNYPYKTEFPIILGRSCSGVILEIGRNVKRFEIGDEVYLTSPFWSQGTISEYYLAKEFRVAHKPKRAGFEGAAGLPYFGSIAINAIRKSGLTKDNASNKRILVLGACTPTGCILIQYCNYLNAKVSTTATDRTVPVAQALGACDVINDKINNSPNLLIKNLEVRDNFDVIFITKQTDLTRNNLRKFCTPQGVIISTLQDYVSSDNFGFFTGGLFWGYVRSKCFLQNIFGLPRVNFGEVEITHSHLDYLTDLVDNHELHSVVDKVFNFYDVELALEHVQSNESIGNSIITFK